jgi:hypothetical protein
VSAFKSTFQQASADEKEHLRGIWQQAGLGPFPEDFES